MKINILRSSALGIAAALMAIPSFAAAQDSSQNMRLVSANARLAHRLDSKDARQGQIVAAQLTSDVKGSGSMELPKGTMLMGKVEQVQMSSNDGPARMSIVFDQARLSNGQSVPVKATLLAAYPADTGDYFAVTGTTGTAMAGQPHFIPDDQQIDQVAGSLSHVSMHSAVQSNASGVFMSTNRNIDLSKGTQLQIAVAPETSPSKGMAAGQ